MNDERFRQHSSHWGTFEARVVGDRLHIRPFAGDPDPSPILQNFQESLSHPLRLARPLIRKGWLNEGPGPDDRRGRDEYVEVDWENALDLVACELKRHGAGPGASTKETIPGSRVFGGSYGWSSAGRFHHAQSQVHRFLNTVFGGYVYSVDSYSSGAGAVILNYVLGPATTLTRDHPVWSELAENSEVVLAFGGLPTKNTAISNGGNTVHGAAACMRQAQARGAKFILVSPLRDDLPAEISCAWLPVRPATDVALMLGMAYHLYERGLVATSYLAEHTVGYDKFEAYLTGASDGVPKTPEWAEPICGISASQVKGIAEMASSHVTLVNVTYSLQRAENGEQPVWMALVLAAMLGHMGKPGGGFSYGLGSIGNIGKHAIGVPLPTFPQGRNLVRDFIPVARIADLLLKPGETYTYKCEERQFADIRLVYWAGGNPFHHHQDLQRLAQAFRKPDTIIVHESVATATTRFADIVLPATITLERADLGASANDPFLFAMEQLARPYGEARDDFDIFAALAQRLGQEAEFTEERTASEWLEAMYERTRVALEKVNWPAPGYEQFWKTRRLELPLLDTPGMVARFHRNPVANALPTPSGRIEISSSVLAESPHAGIAPHPSWIEPEEWLGGSKARDYPFQLVANQPATRLHSQLDFGSHSASLKVAGREPARMNPEDAAALGIGPGTVVRVFNERGALLAGAVLDEKVRRNVIQISTGAWYEPVDVPGSGVTCVKGNPNAVTCDKGASMLSQGCAGQLSLVQVEPCEQRQHSCD